MLNIVMPIAGRGTKFIERGYTFPKPLIEIKGKPMIQIVVENLKPRTDHRFIFIVKKEHCEKYSLDGLLRFLCPGCVIIPLTADTAGAACSALLAKEFINTDDELIIANGDQYLDIDFHNFIDFSKNTSNEGAILTFKSSHPRWSFVKLNKDGRIVEVAEKRPISNLATAGIYYFKKGSFFCEAAESMIEKGIHVNNEFFVAPVYNELILKNKKILPYEIPRDKMYGLGTPEDLEFFEKWYNK